MSTVSVARQGRRTEPLETLHRVVESYSEIEELLSNGESEDRDGIERGRKSDETHAGCTLGDFGL